MALHAIETNRPSPSPPPPLHPNNPNQQANTQQITYADRGFAHVEGGWPKEVDPTEVEHVLRFRKKVEKDEEVRPCLFCAFPESRHRPFDATYGVQLRKYIPTLFTALYGVQSASLTTTISAPEDTTVCALIKSPITRHPYSPP